MNSAKLWLIGTLLIFAICSLSCATPVRYVYRPANDQIFLVPPGAEIVAPNDEKIITDGPDGKVSVGTFTVPVPSILISEDRFMELFREKVKTDGVDNGG